VNVAWQGYSPEKVIVLLFSLAELASRLHFNMQATSQAPSLTTRLLQTCSYLRCSYQARRFTVGRALSSIASLSRYLVSALICQSPRFHMPAVVLFFTTSF
jgi:hypothetical protein